MDGVRVPRLGDILRLPRGLTPETGTGTGVHYLEQFDGGHAGTIDSAATAALNATVYAFPADTLATRLERGG